MNGNPLSGNYFNLNKIHMSGDLLPINLGRKLKRVKTSTLELKPSRAASLAKKTQIDEDDEIDEL